MYLEGSELVTKLLNVLKLLIYKIYFWHQFDFIKAWLMLIQNSSNCWTEKTQIEKKESPQYKLCNNIADLSIRSFWYHNSDTKGNPWVMFVDIAQLMTHPAIYTTPFTLQLCYKPLAILQRVTKSQKVLKSDHDGLKNLRNINFIFDIGYRVSQRRNRVTGISPFPNQVFWEP